jgi:hypothetical protein
MTSREFRQRRCDGQAVGREGRISVTHFSPLNDANALFAIVRVADSKARTEAEA